MANQQTPTSRRIQTSDDVQYPDYYRPSPPDVPMQDLLAEEQTPVHRLSLPLTRCMPGESRVTNIPAEPWRPHSGRWLYTQTSYIGPPAYYCAAWRPPSPSPEREFRYHGEDVHRLPPFPNPYHFSQYPGNGPCPDGREAPMEPFSTYKNNDLVPYVGRPHDRAERCEQLGCWQRGLHFHTPEEQLGRKRQRDDDNISVVSDEEDDLLTRRARRNRAPRRSGLRRVHNSNSLLTSSKKSVVDLEEALPQPKTTEVEPSSPKPQQRPPTRQATLPIRSASALNDRWAKGHQPAIKKRRLAPGGDAEATAGLIKETKPASDSTKETSEEFPLSGATNDSAHDTRMYPPEPVLASEYRSLEDVADLRAALPTIAERLIRRKKWSAKPVDEDKAMPTEEDIAWLFAQEADAVSELRINLRRMTVG